MITRGRLAIDDVVTSMKRPIWPLDLHILITFTERIIQRHMDVSCAFSERSDERPTDVDRITFWAVEVRKLNVGPNVHPTLYGRRCAQWIGPHNWFCLSVIRHYAEYRIYFSWGANHKVRTHNFAIFFFLPWPLPPPPPLYARTQFDLMYIKYNKHSIELVNRSAKLSCYANMSLFSYNMKFIIKCKYLWWIFFKKMHTHASARTHHKIHILNNYFKTFHKGGWKAT